MAIFTFSDQYKYIGRGPLDAKSIVKTYAELTSEATWKHEGQLIAYNGMIVAVWLNKADTSKNGIYFLYDSKVTTALGKPNVTNEANWHKLADASAISEVVSSIESNTQAIAAEEAARIASIAGIYNFNTDGSVTGVLAEEIARAKAAEQANATAIAALMGNDAGKTVRVIASEEVAKLVDTGDKTVSIYVAEQLAKLSQLKASEEITIAEDGTLGIGNVSTDKLIQGAQTLIFNGGNAK